MLLKLVFEKEEGDYCLSKISENILGLNVCVYDYETLICAVERDIEMKTKSTIRQLITRIL